MQLGDIAKIRILLEVVKRDLYGEKCMSDGANFTLEIGEYLDRLKVVLDSVDKDQVNSAINALIDAYKKEKKIYVFGNGGSTTTASHCVCDFNKGVSMELEKKFKFVCLSDNVATVTAIANDFGYENVFLLQLMGKLEEGDIVIAISGSGKSKNIIKAAEYAKRRGNKIISMTGYSGGELLKLADYPIHIDVGNMQLVEDVHMVLCHLMSSVIAKEFGHPMC